MRLWSLHPVYLDTRGLVACWREGLLARKVLKGETKGYKNHPQLQRFKAQPDPLAAIDAYLSGVLDEATRRGYSFNRDKIGPKLSKIKISVTVGQLNYEFQHLLAKLKIRDITHYERIAGTPSILPHPIFDVREGGIENWEKPPAR